MLGLPPPVAPATRHFLPHQLPKSKFTRTPYFGSWELPVQQALSITASSSSRVSPRRAQGLPFPVDHADSVARILRTVASESSLPGTSGGQKAKANDAAKPRGNKLRASDSSGSIRSNSAVRPLGGRLLPSGTDRRKLSARLPSLAYSSYRPLDVWRGATSTPAPRAPPVAIAALATSAPSYADWRSAATAAATASGAVSRAAPSAMEPPKLDHPAGLPVMMPHSPLRIKA